MNTRNSGNAIIKKNILGIPPGGFIAVILFCVTGVIVGSFKDFQINAALANKTEAGAFFATYGSYYSYCLYPAAGVCLYKGLMKMHIAVISGQQGRNSRPVWAIIGGQAREKNPVADFSSH